MNYRIKNLINKKFGKLTAIAFDSISKKHFAIWLCKCDCGNIKFVESRYLIRGKVKSCGCFINIKHGDSYTIFYRRWITMRRRCREKKSYINKNIIVCKRWLRYENFKEDMYKSFLEHINKYDLKNTTLDRINNDGNYEKKNCRWATISEQNSNKDIHKQKIKVTRLKDGFNIIFFTQKKVADNLNLDQGNISRCLGKKQKFHKGWIFSYV